MTFFSGVMRIATLTVQSRYRQNNSPAFIAVKIAFNLAGQAFDAAAALGLIAADVQHRHVTIQRQNFRNAGFNAGFRGAVSAAGIIVSDSATRHGLEGVRLLWIERLTYRKAADWNVRIHQQVQ